VSGIVFLSTTDLRGMVDFYTARVGASVWLDQGGCVILKHGNMLFGFCRGEEADTAGVITFFHGTREEVEAAHKALEQEAEHAPRENPEYRIYHFYARDPEGRRLEVQSFLHPLPGFFDGEELLHNRRSIRRFQPRKVDDETLEKIFSTCRYAPSSRNRQPCTLVVVRSPEKLELLGGLRGENSAPIARAPMAVGVVSDPGLSKRHVQDGCIMAYHLMLAAAYHGLGTCWIAAMDRSEAKQALGVPLDHYIATVTPVGYPAETPAVPDRRDTMVAGC